MPKQYRVIKRIELMSSYIIEVPDGTDLEKVFNDADGWEQHIRWVTYENDPVESRPVEAWTLKEEVDDNSPSILKYDFSNDDECVWEDWD